jgi:zinc protease
MTLFPRPLHMPSVRALARAAGVGLALLAFAVFAEVTRAEGSQRPPRDRSAAVVKLARRPPADRDTLPRDPALTTGTLPNGMRYYIRANKMPAKRAFLWLAVNAGSVLEDEDQQGFAHFLEHMAFNGTKHFPRHELLDQLQRAGMRFGADINAHTGYDETVYTLEVPTDDGKRLTQGLTMLEDWADGGMLIDSGEVLAERGVVLGEWRSGLGDTASQRVVAHRDSLLYGADSRYVSRKPIGLAKLVRTAEPGPIRRFYKDWYRPDLMAVVAVGDFDSKQVEREIKQRFGKIPPPTNPRPRVSQRLLSSSEPVVDVYRGPVYPIALAVWKQSTRRMTTPAAVREQLIEELLLDRLNQKFLRMRQEAGRPFYMAGVGRTSLGVRSTDAFVVQVTAEPDSLQGGLAAVLAELERAAEYGAPAATLARQKAALLRRLEDGAAAAAATPSARYAEEYVAHYMEGDIQLLSAAQELAVAQAVLPTITPQDIAHAASFWHRRSDLAIQYNVPEWAHVSTPSREGVLALFDSVEHMQLAPDSTALHSDAPLLVERPRSGSIVSERRDAVAGIVEWTLSNGARVLFRPTQNDPDELLLDARSPGGFSLVPDSLFFSSGRLVAKMMTEAAGVGKLDREGLLQDLATTGIREFQVSIGNNDESIRLGGSPKDLEMLFQLLYLQFTAPKLDTAALTLWKRVGMEGIDFSPDEQITSILSRGDPRRSPMPMALVNFADVNKAMAVYRDRFGNAGDFTFTIVGAATPQQLRPLVARYLASLPATSRREHPVPLDVRPWNTIVRATNRINPVPRASTFLLFDGVFPESPKEYLTARERLDALAWVLRLKVTDIMRERMGGTYGVGVSQHTYADPTEHFRVMVNFDTAPDRINEMLDTLSVILTDVRTTGATPEELRKVVAMELRSHETELQDNRYWMQAIELYDRLGIPFDRIVRPGVLEPTPADIRTAAQQYLPANAFIQATTLPEDSTFATSEDSASSTPKRVIGPR